MAKKKSDITTGFQTKAEADEHGYTAVCIERLSDGAMLSLNSDLTTYSFSPEVVKGSSNYQYTFERLMEDHRAKGKFKVISLVKNLNLDKYAKFFEKRA